MLAGLKTLASMLYNMPQSDVRQLAGFDAAYLTRNAEHLPHSVWRDERKKRTYVNSVLARAEVSSTYAPARKLWLRMRNGHYLPNPAMRLRVSVAGCQQEWRPVYEVLRLDIVERGNGRGWGRLGSTYRWMLLEAGMTAQAEPPRPQTV
jgi:hypothetical protein